ncbi:MBL fold metallo-hydrolase [Pontibacter actiniarum]|uniref:MBL fold metallo-hydrolase n=1 Tax=Pontibacter actiniarum TaxID=323450 RepID=A0A1X9YUQ5_9BACT|nr:MBL fold metallo-hydrolase [Pontibacter actiniarum]ARS36524.1 MBL fold metallo-hydrolase [Pontibacter actiniarum]
MKIKFLGTGGAFDTDYLNSAALLEFRGMNLLLDCGFTVFPALMRKNLVQKVDHILLTHLHNDHSGSLANLLLYKSIVEQSPKPVILYPSEQFKQQLFKFLEIQVKDPEKYAEFVPLEQFEGISCIDTYGQHSEGMQTYAYIFDNDTMRIAYSGDLARPEALFDRLAKMAEKKTCVFHDITFNPENKGHTYYKKLLPYMNGVEIFGYHCDPTRNPSDNPIRLVFYQHEFLA